MRPVSSVVFVALVTAAACRREPPPSTRPGEITPIDPAGLARLRAAAADAGRPRAPALRVMAMEAIVAEAEIARATPQALIAFRAALVRRLEELGTWSPRASESPRGAELSFAIGRGTLPSIVREQLERPGRVQLVAQCNCPKFTEPPAVAGVNWLPIDTQQTLPTVAPDSDGVARIAPLLETFRLTQLPPTLRWLHSAHRGQDGTVSRRGTCGLADHLAAPAVSVLRATLDPRTLAPMLDATLEMSSIPTFQAWRQAVLRTEDVEPRLVLAVDGEVVGPLQIEEGDGGPMRLTVIPEGRHGSVSPELVGVLWRSGPIDLPFSLRDAQAPTN
jgi:hypothetical protein